MPSTKKNVHVKDLDKYPMLSKRIIIDLPPKKPGAARSKDSIAKYEREYAEWERNKNNKIKREQEKKISLLFEKYNVNQTKSKWKQLCMEICKEIFPGFKTEYPKPGPPVKWDWNTKAILYLEVRLLFYENEKKPNHPKFIISKAAKKLIKRPRWVKQLENVYAHRKIKTLQDMYTNSLKMKEIQLLIQHEEYLIKQNTSIDNIIKEITESLNGLESREKMPHPK